jgi:hypothetical protein
MPLIAIFAIVFSIGAGAGGFTAYKIQEAKVLKMEIAIDDANNRALGVLNAAKIKIHEANLEALNLNKELEDANKIHVETINHYYDALHTELAKRMRANDKASCPDHLSKNSNPGRIEKVTSSESGFSTKYVDFLEKQLKLADEVANYAWTAYGFTSANCGIK